MQQIVRGRLGRQEAKRQELEAKREDALSVVATSIQKVVRGFLARVHYRMWKDILTKQDPRCLLAQVLVELKNRRH